MSKPREVPTAPKLVPVKLITEHTHAGKSCRPGDTLQVSEATANWLRARHLVTTVGESS